MKVRPAGYVPEELWHSMVQEILTAFPTVRRSYWPKCVQVREVELESLRPQIEERFSCRLEDPDAWVP